MTLLVAILCDDGAVIAADKQTSHGTGLSGVTVGHSTTKIQALKHNVLIASSGHRGLGQQFASAVETLTEGFPRQYRKDSVINIQANSENWFSRRSPPLQRLPH